MLFLVLLSGCTAKWAELNNAGMKGLAATQLILSSFIAFAIIATLGFSVRDMLRRHKEKKEKRTSMASIESDADTKKKNRLSSFFTVNVRADDDASAPSLEQQQQQQQLNGGRSKFWNCGRTRAVADDGTSE